MLKKILTILILILIFGVNNVYSLSYDYTIGEQIRVLNVEDTRDVSIPIANGNLTNGYSTYNLKFDYNNGNYDSGMGAYGFSFNNAKFIRIAYSGSLMSYTNESAGINLTESCLDRTGLRQDYTITYADGTHASVDSDYYNNICDLHSIGGITNDINRTISNLQPRIVLIGYNGYQQCEMDNGYILCPVIPNANYYMLRFEFKRYNIVNADIKYDLRFHRAMYTINTDSQQIIDNQNQNQQQNHQDSINTQNKIDDLNNSITDSNVNGNNSNNTISSIGGTFNTENDFLLGLLTIPYTFWTSITNVFSNSCSPLNVGTMFNKPLIFPCIELSDYLGNVFTSIIDVIFAGIIMSAFVRRIIRYYQALLSLDNSATFIGGVKVW